MLETSAARSARGCMRTSSSKSWSYAGALGAAAGTRATFAVATWAESDEEPGGRTSRWNATIGEPIHPRSDTTPPGDGTML